MVTLGSIYLTSVLFLLNHNNYKQSGLESCVWTVTFSVKSSRSCCYIVLYLRISGTLKILGSKIFFRRCIRIVQRWIIDCSESPGDIELLPSYTSLPCLSEYLRSSLLRLCVVVSSLPEAFHILSSSRHRLSSATIKYQPLYYRRPFQTREGRVGVLWKHD
jgi:hypothetical protein